jgi:hypothetical protein
MANESDYWSKTRKEMREEDNLSLFKNWRTVRSIPIYKDNEFPMTYPVEVEYMLRRRHPEEIDRWRQILKEPFLGHTDASYKKARLSFFDGTVSTSWTLKSAHHILTFEGLSGKSIKEYDQIVEFGAGIGETARLILDLGFEGDYFILDLPETGRISNYYLQGKAKICDRLGDIPQGKNTLFIGTWSLSEVPEDYRNEVVAYFRNADFLIIFQRNIFGYDNYDYFTNVFPHKSNTDLTIRPIPWHRGAGGNFYVYASGKKTPSDGRNVVKPEYVLPPISEHRIRVALHLVSRIPHAIWRRRHRLIAAR